MPAVKSTFILVPWYAYASVVGGMGLTYVMAYHRDIIPYDGLSFIGTFLHTLAYDYYPLMLLIFWPAVIAHVLEGLYALKLTRDNGMSVSDQIKWTLQTMFLGFPSTTRLVRLCKKMAK